MFRFRENICAGAAFHDFAVFHYVDGIGYLFYHGEIVCYQQYRHVEFFLETLKKIEDLCLNRDIKCRRRFVRYQ